MGNKFDCSPFSVAYKRISAVRAFTEQGDSFRVAVLEVHAHGTTSARLLSMGNSY